jgi:arsenical pump membrane protein
LTYPLDAATIGIAGLATAGIVARPWKLPEFVWAIAGAAFLVLFNVLPWQDAFSAAAKGTDVYLFLVGMMLLAEVARVEGLFDWLAVQAVRASKASQPRFFLIIYLVGTLVTVFLSNDATAVVLTPAVYAAARAAKVQPLPYLFVCAFIANAASFVLPISNPGEPRRDGSTDATTDGLAEAVCDPLAGLNRRDIYCASPDPASLSGGRRRRR